MANVPLGTVLRQLRRLSGVGLAFEPSDGHRLRRFADLREEGSFVELMKRHGPMVLGVCRRVLRNEHDVEDSFQATFLVLARKASAIAKQESVGSLLHGVAYRIALRVRAQTHRRLKVHREAASTTSSIAPPNRC